MNSAIVIVKCPACGEGRLNAEEILLRLPSLRGFQATYAFTCPSCDTTICKPAPQPVAKVLAEADCPIVVLPASVFSRRPLPPITEEEIEEFSQKLQEQA